MKHDEAKVSTVLDHLAGRDQSQPSGRCGDETSVGSARNLVGEPSLVEQIVLDVILFFPTIFEVRFSSIPSGDLT